MRGGFIGGEDTPTVADSTVNSSEEKKIEDASLTEYNQSINPTVEASSEQIQSAASASTTQPSTTAAASIEPNQPDTSSPTVDSTNQESATDATKFSNLNKDSSSTEPQSKMTIHYYNNDTAKDIDKKELDSITDPYIVFVDDGNTTESHVSNPSNLEIADGKKADVYTYKYDNIANQDATSTADLKKITISPDDIDQTDSSVTDPLGNRVKETDYYIDSQGILRKYNVDTNEIKRVMITDVPDVDNQGNSILIDANNAVLISIQNLLKAVKKTMPEYMIIELNDGKSYVISKENPYIIVDK